MLDANTFSPAYTRRCPMSRKHPLLLCRLRETQSVAVPCPKPVVPIGQNNGGSLPKGCGTELAIVPRYNHQRSAA